MDEVLGKTKNMRMEANVGKEVRAHSYTVWGE